MYKSLFYILKGKTVYKFLFYIFEGRDRREPVGGGRWCNVNVLCIEGRGWREPIGEKVEPYKLL